MLRSAERLSVWVALCAVCLLATSVNGQYQYYRFTNNGATGEFFEIEFMAGSTSHPTTKFDWNSQNNGKVSPPSYYSMLDGVTSWGPQFTGASSVTVNVSSVVTLDAVKVTLPTWTTMTAFTLEGGTSMSGPWTTLLTKTGLSQTGGAVSYAISSSPTAPSITTHPASATVTAPATATFSVAASGTAPLSYQWQKNSANISGATSASYTTPATTTADNGATFRCVVSNSAGSATSSSATLTVNSTTTPPSITSQPSNVTVTVGGAATFSVAASGSTPLSYQWYKNNSVVSGATSASYTTPATTTADNNNNYFCAVSNAYGSASSNLAYLTVNSAPSGSMKIGTNFWYSGWMTTPIDSTYPFVSNATFAAGTNPWKSALLTELGYYSSGAALRMMDWNNTNDNMLVTWAQRRLPTSTVQIGMYHGITEGSNGSIDCTALRKFGNENTQAGVAYEWMIDLCNRTSRDLYITIPHMADDDHITKLARAIRYGTDGTNPYTSVQGSPTWAPLNSGLKVYVEYSNEVWNPMFGQFHYALWAGSNGNYKGITFTGDCNQRSNKFQGYRSQEIFSIFYSVFSGQTSRVVRVVGAQCVADTNRNNNYLQGITMAGGSGADAFAVAPYLGNWMGYWPNETWHRGDGAAVWDSMSWDITSNKTYLSSMNKTWANNHGMYLIAYEGGQHWTNWRADGSPDTSNHWPYYLNNDSRMYDTYIQYFNALKPYYNLFCHYAHTGLNTFTSGGAIMNWGATPRIGDAVSTTKKLRAIKDWVTANP